MSAGKVDPLAVLHVAGITLDAHGLPISAEEVRQSRAAITALVAAASPMLRYNHKPTREEKDALRAALSAFPEAQS